VRDWEKGEDYYLGRPLVFRGHGRNFRAPRRNRCNKLEQRRRTEEQKGREEAKNDPLDNECRGYDYQKKGTGLYMTSYFRGLVDGKQRKRERNVVRIPREENCQEKKRDKIRPLKGRMGPRINLGGFLKKKEKEKEKTAGKGVNPSC